MADAPWPTRGAQPWDDMLRAYVDQQISRAAADQSVIDAKGDLIAGSADNIGMRLAVGTPGQIPTADPSAPTGIKWIARNWANVVPTTLSSGTDFNTQKTGGAYLVAGDGATLTNIPPGFASGLLEVFDLPGGGYTIQRYTQFDNTDTAFRFFNNNAWTAWRVFTPADKTLLKSLIDAKGDLLVGTADNTPVRKGAGVQGARLEVDTNSADGLSWDVQPELARNLATNPRFGVGFENNSNITDIAPGVVVSDHPLGLTSVTRGTQQAGNNDTTVFSNYDLETTSSARGVRRYIGVWVKAETSGLATSLYLGDDTAGTADQRTLPVNVWILLPTPNSGTGPSVLSITAQTTDQAKTASVLVGGVMCSTTPIRAASDYCDGAQPGCFWAGAADNSQSIRTSYAKGGVLEVGSAPQLARNRLLNPSFKTGGVTSPWQGDGPATGTRVYDGSSATFTSTGTGEGGFISSVVQGVSPGQVWSARVPCRLNVAKTARVCLIWRDAAGNYLGLSSSPSTALAANVDTNVTVVGTAPANAAGVQVQVLGEGLVATNVFRVSRGMADAVSVLTGYFDGDSPGCRWLGPAGASESIKMLESKADYDMLVWLDAGLAQGVGSPEGRVSAPVGAKYRDTMGHLPADGGIGTGAIEWTKVKGGIGPTGWKVTVGDTGWRRLDNVLAAGFTGYAGIRRTNDVVEMGILLVTSANVVSEGAWSTWYNVPVGFTSGPYGAANPIYKGSNYQLRSTSDRKYDVIARGGDRPAGFSFEGSYVYTTTDPWPTVSLPGYGA